MRTDFLPSPSTAQSFLRLWSGVILWVYQGVRIGSGMSSGFGSNECIILRYRSGGLGGVCIHERKRNKLWRVFRPRRAVLMMRPSGRAVSTFRNFQLTILGAKFASQGNDFRLGKGVKKSLALSEGESKVGDTDHSFTQRRKIKILWRFLPLFSLLAKVAKCTGRLCSYQCDCHHR